MNNRIDPKILVSYLPGGEAYGKPVRIGYYFPSLHLSGDGREFIVRPPEHSGLIIEGRSGTPTDRENNTPILSEEQLFAVRPYKLRMDVALDALDLAREYERVVGDLIVYEIMGIGNQGLDLPGNLGEIWDIPRDSKVKMIEPPQLPPLQSMRLHAKGIKAIQPLENIVIAERS